jgi:hypothetical protein
MRQPRRSFEAMHAEIQMHDIVVLGEDLPAAPLRPSKRQPVFPAGAARLWTTVIFHRFGWPPAVVKVPSRRGARVGAVT